MTIPDEAVQAAIKAADDYYDVNESVGEMSIRKAYFDAVSKWFQDRHYRRMDSERALSSQPVADHIADAGKMVADGWLPIETAPKDGTLILAWNYNSGMQVVGWQPAYGEAPFNEDHWDDVGSKNAAPSIFVNARHFTHWRPLPVSPEVSG